MTTAGKSTETREGGCTVARSKLRAVTVRESSGCTHASESAQQNCKQMPAAHGCSALRWPVPALRFAVRLLWLAPLLYLWQGLIRHLSVEWSLNPGYTFGWAVPGLCLYLIWRDLRRNSSAASERSGPLKQVTFGKGALALVLAFAYAPTRFIQEANPEWRLVSWALAFEVIGLTWIWLSFLQRSLLSAAFPPSRFSLSAFPLFFFFVAVPWPTVIEQPLLRILTSATTGASAELLRLFNVPAVLHGNIIEVGSGAIAVGAACSGIRSFQAALMLSLFFGELYHLSRARRLFCVIMALGVSLACNLARTTLLSFIVARQAPAGLAAWHDPAGLGILLACFGGIWLLAFLLSSANGAVAREAKLFSLRNRALPVSINSVPVVAGALLLAWIVIVELATEAWYRVHEKPVAVSAVWHPVLTSDLPGFHQIGFTRESRQFLRFDEGLNIAWKEMDGLRWQAIYLRWNPGKVAVCLARNHTPQDCLLASGHQLVGRSELQLVSVAGLELPFRHYLAGRADAPLHVFYCLWEDRAGGQASEGEWLTYSNRLKAVREGRRNCGQRSLELAIWGAANETQAEAALGRLARRIVRLGN